MNKTTPCLTPHILKWNRPQMLKIKDKKNVKAQRKETQKKKHKIVADIIINSKKLNVI